jgi:hypothetical protein
MVASMCITIRQFELDTAAIGMDGPGLPDVNGNLPQRIDKRETIEPIDN